MLDAPPPYRRPLCATCGQQPRRRGFPTCERCAAQAIARQQAPLDAVWRASQAYVRPPPEPTPPTSPSKPSTPCPRCGNGRWLDLGNGIWHCPCGFAHENPDGPRRPLDGL
jgi:hypothetical protein